MRIAIAILGCLLVIGVAVAWTSEEGPSDSTQGATLIGNNLARVPQGETVVITYKTTKTYETWRLTHESGRVIVTCSGLCNTPAPAILCGIDCEIAVDAGVVSEFKVRLLEDGAVSVSWPEGWMWTYQPFIP